MTRKHCFKTVEHRSETLFVALPVNLQRPITGGCQCGYCKAHPGRTPMWDALAVPADGSHSWSVHYPDLPATGSLTLTEQ